MHSILTICGLYFLSPEMVVAEAPLSYTAIQTESNQDILQQYMKAYNAHDIEGLLRYISDDFRWYSVDGDKISIEVEGKIAVREGLLGYFKSIPNARSEVGDVTVNGDYLAVKETAFWITNGEERQQTSIAVYLIVDGKIRTVWYYPAQ